MFTSFRSRLALRFGITVMFMALAGAAIGYAALREILYDQLDKSLRRLAEIEAAATADSPDESVHFHEEAFASSVNGEAILMRYAEVWTLEGEPVVRTRNLEGRDIPLPDEVRGRVSSSGGAELFTFEWQGLNYRGLLYPLQLIGAQHEHHLLEVVAPLEQTEAVLDNFLRTFGMLVLLGTGVAWVLGWWLAGHAVRPVMEIIRQAESLDMSSPEHRMTARAETEELRRLVSVLNSMLGRIDTAFGNQRRFLADAGHEIKTPLTVLRGDVEVALRRERTSEEYKVVLEQTLQDLKDVSALADDLITLARSDSEGLQPRLTDVQLEPPLYRLANKYRTAAADAGVRLDVSVAQELVVRADPALLDRAVSNLIDNAIKYGADGGRVLLSATSEPDGQIRISVADNGPGIPEDEADHLFERFYRGQTGRRCARGSGLGLAIVKAILESHGGRVYVDSETQRGTTVNLLLPAGRTVSHGSRSQQRDPAKVDAATYDTGPGSLSA